MPKSLVFIGDSLTEWFDWQYRFPRHHVTNLGVAGETVEGLLHRLDRIRSRIGSPDIIFVMTGANNITMERFDIIGTYREIISSLTAWFKNATLVVQSVLPVRMEWIDNNVIRDINRRLEQMAEEFHADYLDVYRIFVDAKGNPKTGFLLDDGVHLSGTGYEAWANEVERFLKKRQQAADGRR